MYFFLIFCLVSVCLIFFYTTNFNTHTTDNILYYIIFCLLLVMEKIRLRIWFGMSKIYLVPRFYFCCCQNWEKWYRHFWGKIDWSIVLCRIFAARSLQSRFGCYELQKRNCLLLLFVCVFHFKYNNYIDKQIVKYVYYCINLFKNMRLVCVHLFIG